MNRIKDILDNNNSNSSESALLDKIDMLSINYDDGISVKINDYKIDLSTMVAKMLSDNVSSATDSAWLNMLSLGYTNYKKMNKIKKEEGGAIKKSSLPLIPKKDTVLMTADDFKSHKIGLYSQFIDELDALTQRYSIPQMHFYPDVLFSELDSVEYEARLADEKPSRIVLDEIENCLIQYDSLTKNNSHYILVINEDEKMIDVKKTVEQLVKCFKNVKRVDYIITFEFEAI